MFPQNRTCEDADAIIKLYKENIILNILQDIPLSYVKMKFEKKNTFLI